MATSHLTPLEAAWPPALVLDIALESHDLPELLEKYDLTQVDLDRLYRNQNFRRELLTTRAELTTNGSAFRARARALAEHHLQTMHTLMDDPGVAAQTKVSIWQAFTKYAALEPAKESTTDGSAPKVTIEVKTYTGLTAPSASRAQVIQAQPTPALPQPVTQTSIGITVGDTQALNHSFSVDEDWLDA